MKHLLSLLALSTIVGSAFATESTVDLSTPAIESRIELATSTNYFTPRTEPVFAPAPTKFFPEPTSDAPAFSQIYLYNFKVKQSVLVGAIPIGQLTNIAGKYNAEIVALAGLSNTSPTIGVAAVANFRIADQLSLTLGLAALGQKDEVPQLGSFVFGFRYQTKK